MKNIKRQGRGVGFHFFKNRYYTPFIFLFLLALAYPVSAETPAPAERVLIYDIKSSLLNPLELETLVSELSDTLIKGGLAVIDSRTRNDALKELEFGLSGVSTDRLRAGQFLSASHIITGSIGPAGKSEFVLNLQLLHTETGEILKTANRRYQSLAMLLSDAKNVVASLLLPVPEIPKDYTVITAASQKNFSFFPLQYGYLQNNGETILRVHGIGPMLMITTGRPWGLVGGGGAAFPLSVTVDGVSLEIKTLTVPVIFEGFIGLSYIADVGKNLLLQGAFGAAFQEFLTLRSSGPFIENETGVFMDFGVFLSANGLFRLKLDEYISLGARVICFPHILPWGGPKGNIGLSAQLALSYGFGRN